MFVTFTPAVATLIAMWHYGWFANLRALEGGWLIIAAILAIAVTVGTVLAMLLSKCFKQEWQQTLAEALVPFTDGQFWQHTNAVRGGGHFALHTRELLRIQVKTSEGSSRVRTIPAHNEIRRVPEASAQLVTEVRRPVWAHAWLIATFLEPERQFLQVPA